MIFLHADTLPKLAGPWRLVFSGPNKLAFLSYIPVDEDFVISTADSSLALESDLGPFRAKFKGQFKWRGDANEMDFAFNLAQVEMSGQSMCGTQRSAINCQSSQRGMPAQLSQTLITLKLSQVWCPSSEQASRILLLYSWEERLF